MYKDNYASQAGSPQPATLMQDARNLDLNTSAAAEAGILEAVRKAKESAWLQNNQEAIAAYNRKIRESGLATPPRWARE